MKPFHLGCSNHSYIMSKLNFLTKIFTTAQLGSVIFQANTGLERAARLSVQLWIRNVSVKNSFVNYSGFYRILKRWSNVRYILGPIFEKQNTFLFRPILFLVLKTSYLIVFEHQKKAGQLMLTFPGIEKWFNSLILDFSRAN